MTATGAIHSQDRVVAQVMDIGTYEDILRLEAGLGRERLAEVMRHAEPGWISARSWDFWARLIAGAGRFANAGASANGASMQPGVF